MAKMREREVRDQGHQIARNREKIEKIEKIRKIGKIRRRKRVKIEVDIKK